MRDDTQDRPEMNSKDFVPILLRHLLKRARARNASIGHQHMRTAELVQSSLDNAFAVLGRSNRCDRLAASCSMHVQ